MSKQVMDSNSLFIARWRMELGFAEKKTVAYFHSHHTNDCDRSFYVISPINFPSYFIRILFFFLVRNRPSPNQLH